MATTPQSMPNQPPQGAAPTQDAPSPQGAPDQGAAPAAGGSQAPASPMQMVLARWYQQAKQLASMDPRAAAGAEKIAQGIQEIQTALVSPPQPTPTGQQPQY